MCRYVSAIYAQKSQTLKPYWQTSHQERLRIHLCTRWSAKTQILLAAQKHAWTVLIERRMHCRVIMYTVYKHRQSPELACKSENRVKAIKYGISLLAWYISTVPPSCIRRSHQDLIGIPGEVGATYADETATIHGSTPQHHIAHCSHSQSVIRMITYHCKWAKNYYSCTTLAYVYNLTIIITQDSSSSTQSGRERQSTLSASFTSKIPSPKLDFSPIRFWDVLWPLLMLHQPNTLVIKMAPWWHPLQAGKEFDDILHGAWISLTTVSATRARLLRFTGLMGLFRFAGYKSLGFKDQALKIWYTCHTIIIEIWM